MRQGDLYDTARNTALTLQRAMLTAPPPVDGLDIAVRYRPAGHDEVGGDWYDAFPLDTGEIGLVVSDIAGHDLTAATVMGQVRSMLRGFAIHDGGPPDQTLTAVDHVIRTLQLTLLATCLYARVDPQPTAEGHAVTWSNAGHSAPVILHPDGSTTVLDSPRDPVLGIPSAAPC
ncbi:hypothetical protein GCM10009836_03350 [Pseudonocardia ailaonensis]|uniref:PPM-type phosphatase domain-containing protein n=1 Tax=Pseudonocardia ailaonensis TaxID=367279 RepID=A0ABN2MJM1_9PSEU